MASRYIRSLWDLAVAAMEAAAEASRKNRQSGSAGHGGDCISRRGKPSGMRTRQPGPARGEAVMSAEHVVPLDAEHGAEAEAPPEARARALGRYHKWAVLALVAVGTFMTALDASIVNIGLPSIARAFRAPVGGAIEWVIIVYLVVIAGTLLTFGRLSDLVGRKPVWMTGLALFTLGSVLCAAASSLPMLVVARAMQGLGGALIFAPGLAIIADAFPPAERGRALGERRGIRDRHELRPHSRVASQRQRAPRYLPR